MTDSDATDSYPAVINGLVYATGEFKCDSPSNVEGVMVAGNDISFWSTMTVNYNPVFFNNPPPGFTSGNEVKIFRGSWTRAASSGL